MATSTTQTNKPFNPRGNDQSPKGYNRAKLYSGKALDFDGVNDNIIASSFSGLSGEAKASISLYFNWDAINSDENWFIGQDNPTDRVFAFGYVGSTNELKLQINGTNTTSDLGTYDFNTGEWYHYLFTFDTTTNAVVIYVNGQQVATGTQTKDFISATSDLYIGQREYSGNEGRINGKIANVKIFNTALTAAQVADLYNNPEKVVPTGVNNTALKLWLPMMEGAGTTAYDGSGNGNHGTISGATWTHGIGAPVAQSAVMDWNKGVNLLDEYSEDFSDSGWLKTGSQILASSESNPYGKQTWEFGVVSLPTEVQVRANISGSTPTSTAFKSFVIAKAGTLNWLRVRNLFVAGGSTEGNVWFNLSTGSVGTEQSGQTGTMTDLGDGWYKCEVSGTTAAAIPNYFFDVGFTDRDGWNEPLATGGTGFLVLSSISLNGVYVETLGTAQTSEVLLPQGLTTGRDITGVNLFENVRKQGALNLDGNSWAEVHDNASLDITDAITLEAWVYWDDSNQDSKGILGKWDFSTSKKAFILFQDTGGAVAKFNISANGNTTISGPSTGTLTNNEWVHLVGTYDGANIRLYVNGSESSNTASSVTLFTTDINLDIGQFDNSSRAYTDQIAQPRIYNRALTAEEVQRSYDSGKNIYTNS